jgi:hypothetical protein
MDLNGKPISETIPDDLETKTITAEEEFKLLGKYILPKTKPSLNNVILAGAGVGPAGEVICEWGVELGGGDVVGPPGAIDNNLCAFDGASGKTIKDSGILLSNVIANPVSTNINMNNNSIINGLNIEGQEIIIDDNTNTAQWSLTHNNLTNSLELKDSSNDLIYDVSTATDQTTYYKTLNVYNTQVPFSRFNIGSSAMIHDRADSNAFGAGYTGRKARGDFSSKTPVLLDDVVVSLRGDAFNSFTYNRIAEIYFKANENQSLSDKGGRIEFQTANNGNNAITNKMTIDSEVKVEGGMIVHNSSNLSKYDFNETQFIMTRGDDQPFGLQLIAQKARGSLSAPTAVLSQDILLNLRGISYTGSNYGTNADIKILSNENQTISDRGGKIIFETTDLGSTTPTNKLTIDDQVKIENDLVLGNASPGTSYTLLSTRGTSGQYLATDGLGVTSWESFEQASYAEQFINGNATPTAFGMVNTYADILGTRITGNINGFTAQALSVTYTATPTKIFQLVCSISCLSDGLFAQNYFLSFFKNGVLVPEGTMHTKLDNNTATFPTIAHRACW